MKKIIFVWSIVFGLLVFIQPLKSQKEIRGKQFFTELGGPGVIGSINFDSRFKNNERLGFGYRVGFGFGLHTFSEEGERYIGGLDYGYETKEFLRTYYTIPFGLNYVLGKKNSGHTFEIGAGATFLTRKISLTYFYDYNSPGHFIGHLAFMYRRVPIDGGFTFRVGFTPIIGTSGDLSPMGAIGFGYSF
jgi:hypothetical protein